jgi:SnoaL-like domain
VSPDHTVNELNGSAVSVDDGTVIPAPVAACLHAINRHDLEALLATFVDDAVVNDQLRDYRGRAAIAEWASRDVIAERLTLKVVEAEQHHGQVIVIVHADGLFDKRGLPDPLVLTAYFSVFGDRIVQLIILRNQSGT